MSSTWGDLPWRERWRETARYRYRRVDGTILFEHVRWATRHPSGIDPVIERPKTFTYRWRDEHRQTHIGLPSGLDEADAHLIYQLDVLAKVVAGQIKPKAGWSIPPHPQTLPPLVICEGEKDVEALADIGYAATTAHGGAMHGWGEAETAWLDRIGWHGEIWLAVDQDDAGWYHAMRALRTFHPYDWSLRCMQPVVGKDPHDAIVAHGLGRAWWKHVDPLIVTLRGERTERKLRAAGEGAAGQGLVNGYRIDVAGWKQRELNELIAKEDW